MTRCLVILAILLQLGSLWAVDKFAFPASAQGICDVPMTAIGTTGDAAVNKNNSIVTVNIPKKHHISNETRGAVITFDMKSLKNKVVCVKAQVRYTEVGSDTQGPHVGVKLLCDFSSPHSGRTFVFSPSCIGSSNGWQNLEVYCPLNEFITEARVILGLQQAWGKAEFRNISAEVVAPADAGPKTYSVPANFRCEYSDKVLNAPMGRGFMTPPPNRITKQDIQDMAKLNVNLIRYQIVDGLKNYWDLAAYDKWMTECLDKLDSLMPELKAAGIKVVIDMHRPPGYRIGYAPFPKAPGTELVKKINPHLIHRVMVEENQYNFYIFTWQKIARRYKDNPIIYGYDLINEPYVSGPTPYHWQDLQYAAAKAIREIDPEMPIIVEGNYLANPSMFNMTPMPLKNIIYQVHMYNPMTYSHQGVGHKAYIERYPQYAIKYNYSKDFLRKSMQPTIDFMEKYGAKIYVGEFSVTRWSPDAARYLDDLISVFEELKWDWTYHAFREWDGWSLEHDSNPANTQKAKKTTDRMQVMIKYLKKNISAKL